MCALFYLMIGYFIYYQLASFKEGVLAKKINLTSNNIDFYEEALKSPNWSRLPEITGEETADQLTFSEFIKRIKKYHTWKYLKATEYKKLNNEVQRVMHNVCSIMSTEFSSSAIKTVKEDVDITSLSEMYFAELVVKQLKESNKDKNAFANMERIGSVVYATNHTSYIKKAAFDSIDSR